MAGKHGPNRGRRECIHKVRTTLRTFEVEIRFDRNEGVFFALLEEEEFKDESIRELEDTLEEKAREMDNVTWETWISYQLVDDGTYKTNNKIKYHQEDKAVVGVNFKCVDLSVKQEGIAQRERDRRPDDDGCLDEINEDSLGQVNYWHSGIKKIRFTPERWRALKQIEAAIIDARKKLGSLLDVDDHADVEVQLDSMTTPLLLAGAQGE